MKDTEITIEQLNQLKRENDKWMKIGGTLLALIFLLPLCVFIIALLRTTSIFSGSHGFSMLWPGSSFGVLFLLFFIFLAGAIAVTIIRNVRLIVRHIKNVFRIRCCLGI